MTVVVRGGSKFHEVARRLRTAANRKDMVRALRDGINKATPEMKDAVRERAHEFLPDRYAAELVPSLRMTTSTSTSGDQVTVRLIVTARGHGGNARQVGDLEDGELKHPVFGRSRKLRRHWVHGAASKPNPWVWQRVRPGFVTEPMDDKRPQVRGKIEDAVGRVLTGLTEG